LDFIYQELRTIRPPTASFEIEKAWQNALVLSGGLKLNDRLYWSTEAGKWGLRLKKTDTSGGTHYSLEEVNLPSAWERLAETDLSQVIRLVQQWGQDQEILAKGGSTASHELLPDEIAHFNLLDTPPALPEGDPLTVSRDHQVTKDRISLLAKFRQMKGLMPPTDLSYFETLLALAEQSPEGEATLHYAQAAQFIKGFYNTRDFELASQMTGRLGGSLFNRGYREKGEALLLLSLNNLLGNPEWFVHPEGGVPKIELWGVESKDLKKLNWLLKSLAGTEGGDFIVQKLLQFVDVLTELAGERSHLPSHEEGISASY
jgi:hypothetical protein